MDCDAKLNKYFADCSTNIRPPNTFYVCNGKRWFDVGLALALLPVLLPIMTLITIGMAHRGNIIFGHRRAGHLGKEFTCYKFRTMVVDADNRLAEILTNDPSARAEWERNNKLKDDPRITRLGSVLRKTSLDELPQIFNVLRGDMSFVGPRPVTRAELPKYGDLVMTYMAVRPGITGPWQIGGRNNIDYTERVVLDAKYVEDIKFTKDVKMIVKTISVPLTLSGQ